MSFRMLTVPMFLVCSVGCVFGGNQKEGGPEGLAAIYGDILADVDSDQDGLLDLDEMTTAGTDPYNPDSDGDSYLDGDEAALEFDPLDDNSVIYAGGWPYNSDKDEIEDPGMDGTQAYVGEVFANFSGADQFGDKPSIYDFAYQGKPVIVDLSAAWCGWCKEMAMWLDGNPASYFDGEWPELQKAVEDGDIQWITILDGDVNGPATQQTVKEWYQAYPHDLVPVLADKNAVVAPYLATNAYPTVIILKEDMTVDYYGDYYGDALDYANAELVP